VGDFIYFDVSSDKSGKKRAQNASIEGVLAKPYRSHKPKNTSVKLYVISLIIVGLLGGYLFKIFIFGSDPVISNFGGIFETEDFTGFSCEGKQHCSQMNSCKEARFYLEHCPNVKIDGNNDGVPCELQWCN